VRMFDRIEALAGPLPKGREWERWCEYTQPLSLPERGKADAAIAELEAKVEELDDKLMEAEGAHENARRWFEEQKKQFARAEKAEAERDQALFVADGWHRQFKHAAEVRRAERVRAEKAEAEARRWEWLAKEASRDRRTPDGPLLDTLLARYEEAPMTEPIPTARARYYRARHDARLARRMWRQAQSALRAWAERTLPAVRRAYKLLEPWMLAHERRRLVETLRRIRDDRS